MEKEYTSVESELKKGRFIIISTSGVSMQPLLYDKRKKKATQVLVEPLKGDPEPGDLPVFIRYDGKYVIHRIVKKVTDGQGNVQMYYTRGDNCMSCEKISPDAVLGLVSEIYRKGRTIKVTDKGYKVYVRIWNMIFPLRYIWYRIRIYLYAIIRRIRSR